MILPSFAFVRKEWKEISRDRRAILLSFVLPIFVYPATFSLTSFLERREEQRVEGVFDRVAVTGDAEGLRARLRAEGAFVVVRPEEGLDLGEEVRLGRLEAWIDVPEGVMPRDGELPQIRVVHFGPNDASARATERIEEVLEDFRREEADRRLAAAGAGRGRLEDLVRVEAVDVATEKETGGARAGRMIPLLLVMTLFIGGSSLSTDLFAGEKERGTLETLYLTPVDRSRIARSKFLVVWGAVSVTGILNLASLLACFGAGLISDPAGGGRVVIGTEGLATAFLLVIPLAALVGGALLGISAFARSLKEAQYYVTPVMLVAVLPGLLAMGQDVRLNALTAFLPITNVALAVRDGLIGPVPPAILALVAAASAGWAWLAMRWTTGVLSREDTILGFDPEPFLARTRSGRRRAAFLAMAASVLVYFYAGNLLQAWRLVPGLLLSLWALLPLLAAASFALARSGGGVADVLSLRGARPGAFAGAALVGAGLVTPMLHGVAALQDRVLPSPEGLFEPLTDPLEDLSLPAMLFTLAISPGVNEELLFRGVFLGLLRRTGGTGSAVLASSAFFALIHLSVFRFAPTFLVGVLLALVVVASRSLFPAMLLHAVYNGVAMAAERSEWLSARLPEPAGWAASVVALAAGTWLAFGRQSPSTRRPIPPM